MVKLMRKFINDRLYDPYKFDEEQVTKLLTLMEENGVLPPRVELTIGGADNAWEAEDETK